MSARTPPTPDGKRWTVESLSRNGATANAWSDSTRRLVVLGYITAAALPLIGFMLGIVVAIRPSRANSKHGALIIVLSIVASTVWIVLITSGVLRLSTNDLNS